ncbi:hypothetical protein ACET3Z_006311 [Daucus carota]
MRDLGSASSFKSLRFKLNSVQTYMSSALTDKEETFSTLDLVSGDKVEFLLIIAPVGPSYRLARAAFEVSEEYNVSAKVCVLWPDGTLFSETDIDPNLDSKRSDELLELQHVIEEKSNMLSAKETKIDNLMEEIVNLERELEISKKLLDESHIEG